MGEVRQSLVSDTASAMAGVLCSSGSILLQCLEGGPQQANRSLLLQCSATATLDPYGVSKTASMALLHELMARASIMGQAGLSPAGAREPVTIRP
jgi:hypothetical protein